jgi:ferredoxin
LTYVVNESCIKCKLMDCVEVCPVDCFYEGENMLVIHPDECIDCGVCEPECPVDAIKPDTEPGLEAWLSLNAETRNLAKYYDQERAPPDSKEWEGKPDKLQYFSPNPGATSDSGLSDLGLAGIPAVVCLYNPPQLARFVVGGL